MSWDNSPHNDNGVIDLDKMAKDIKGKLPHFKGGALGVILVFLAVVTVFSSYYTVEPEEQGVVLRLGQYSKTTDPGLHFKLPLGVEKVYKVKTKRVHKQEFGFRTREAGIRTQYEKRGFDEESLMLTGDLNVVDMELIVQYRIKDPLQYLFKVRNVERTIRDVSEAVVRRIAGNQTFDNILSSRVEFATTAQEELQEVLDSYETGIKVITVKLQDVNPPNAVKAAFNEVNEAIQDRERAINQAQETYNNQVPRARGEAERTIAKAEGYALERVNNAKGDAARFLVVLKEYKKAQRVTRNRLYLEALSDMLPRMKEIYVIDGKQKALLPFLSIGKGKGVAK
jgi:membrane protease subunit HflK